MIAPDVERTRAPHIAGEPAMLEGWLEFHRSTLLHKCAGLTGEQLTRAACPPSQLTLLGLVRHMAEVERWWFRRNAAGEPLPDLYCSEASPDGDFDDLATADPATDLATFTGSWRRPGRPPPGGRSMTRSGTPATAPRSPYAGCTST